MSFKYYAVVEHDTNGTNSAPIEYRGVMEFAGPMEQVSKKNISVIISKHFGLGGDPENSGIKLTSLSRLH